MFVTKKAKAGLAGVGITLATLTAPAIADTDRAGAEGAPIILAQAASFDDATVEGFASAEMAIQEIRATYIPRLDEAESDEERAAIQQEATDAMVSAVEDTDNITVEEYNGIVGAVAENPELAQRVEQEIANQAQ